MLGPAAKRARCRRSPDAGIPESSSNAGQERSLTKVRLEAGLNFGCGAQEARPGKNARNDAVSANMVKSEMAAWNEAGYKTFSLLQDRKFWCVQCRVKIDTSSWLGKPVDGL